MVCGLCHWQSFARNITMNGFGVLQMHDLEKKLLNEVRADAKVIACRFPLPNLRADKIIGGGIDTVWLYNITNKT